MATADAFHAKVNAVRPTGADGKLGKGVVFIAVLKHEKRPIDKLEQSDLIWMRCPVGRKLEAATKAYKKLSQISEVVFRHDCKTVNENTLVGPLNWRQDDLVVLEAMKTSNVITENISSPERRPLHEITNTSTTTPQPKTERGDTKATIPKDEPANTKFNCDAPMYGQSSQNHANTQQQT